MMADFDDIAKFVEILSSMRDPYDHHGSRVAEYAVKLAKQVDLPEKDIKLIKMGAHLHDVGKLLIRKDLLHLPRKLTDEERAEMETHSPLGWAIVNQAGYELEIQQIVRHHHEHYDGSGYPDGLKTNEIPIGAQIVGLCDVYEALTSRRAYRDAYSHNFAMAFIQKSKTTLFDPMLVDLFFAKVVTHG